MGPMTLTTWWPRERGSPIVKNRDPGGGTQARLLPTLTVTLTFLTLNKIHLQEYLSIIKSFQFNLPWLMRFDNYIGAKNLQGFDKGLCLTPRVPRWGRLLTLIFSSMPLTKAVTWRLNQDDAFLCSSKINGYQKYSNTHLNYWKKCLLKLIWQNYFCFIVSLTNN